SVMSNKPIRNDVAMTGEVTLRGKVLPVGGIKEKVLAARRAGIKRVILPAKNDKDVKEMAPHLRRGMEFIFAEKMEEVLKAALAAPPSPRRGTEAEGEKAFRVRSRWKEARA
ncbi:MAG: magnesium chelatase domain-containing protein, partial [candidate division NC10 bacterium]|nr:magnesium chelatase domain-containing protein [candidate division NC10 bacterium]